MTFAVFGDMAYNIGILSSTARSYFLFLLGLSSALSDQGSGSDSICNTAEPPARPVESLNKTGRSGSQSEGLKSAFTLIETLVVCGIVLLLAGIIFPALTSARRRGQQASDMESMHQLALAGSMYQENYSHFPRFVNQLVDASAVPPEICGLKSDQVSIGARNYHIKYFGGLEQIQPMLTKYKNSVNCIGDYGYFQQVVDRIDTDPNAGWAFLSLELEPDERPPYFWGKKQYRIRSDGGVKAYPLPLTTTQTGHRLVNLNLFGLD
ncbi:hypothetical protein BH11ARM1_BH11ARM1_11610 [soil metagenome]